MENYRGRYIVFGVFLFAIMIHSLFIVPHYSHDSYLIHDNMYEHVIQSSTLGRPLMSLLTYIFMKMHFDLIDNQSIFTILATFINSIAVYVIYTTFSNSTKNKLLLLSGCYFIVFNLYAVEMYYFSFMLPFTSIAVTLLVLASRLSTNMTVKKFVISILLVSSSLFLYQGWGGLYIPLSFMVLSVNMSKKIVKKDILNASKVVGVYLVSSVLNLIYIKGIHPFFYDRVSIRTEDNINIMNNIKRIIDTLDDVFLTSFNIFPKYSYLLLLLSLILILIVSFKGNIKSIAICIGILVTLFVMSLFPHVITASVWIVPRSIMSLGALIGMLIVMICISSLDLTIKIKRTLQVSIIIIVLFTSVNTNIIASDTLTTNSLDKELAIVINDYIKAYENETSQDVTKIAIKNDEYPTWCYKDIRCYGDYNVRSLVTFAAPRVINYYTNENYILVDYDDVGERELVINWDNFNENQILIVGDTAYITMY